MSKRKAREVSVRTSLGDLLARSEIPTLSKGNQSMQSTPHIEDTGHGEAAPVLKDIALPEGELFLPEGVETQPSALLTDLGNADHFTYQNETKVQFLVAACLKDALRSLDLYDDFAVESEYSIFSLRPDIVVVSHIGKGIVLVIEIKKPGDGVFESHEVGGQVFDYLVGELLSGVNTPFAVLSCYDEMCIAHLDDGGASREILDRNASQLSEDVDTDILASFGIVGHDSKQSPNRSELESAPSRPPSKLNRVFGQSEPPVDVGGSDGDEEEEENNVEEKPTNDEDEDWGRAVIYTQTFTGESAIKALVLAIRCGLESIAKSDPRNVPLPGASVGGSCARVNTEGLVYGNMPTNICFSYTKFPGPTTKMLYLWRDLGRGSKGRVFLACNTGGNACAVKFFLINYDTYHRQEGTRADRQAFRQAQMKIKEAEANREKDYWLQVYGDTFKDQVRVVQLNNHWCLMMPYFDQVAEDQREDCLDEVRNHLARFKEMGLHYDTKDLRWRHIGVRRCIPYIFDLGSLVTCNSADVDIDASMNILSDKI